MDLSVENSWLICLPGFTTAVVRLRAHLLSPGLSYQVWRQGLGYQSRLENVHSQESGGALANFLRIQNLRGDYQIPSWLGYAAHYHLCDQCITKSDFLYTCTSPARIKPRLGRRTFLSHLLVIPYRFLLVGGSRLGVMPFDIVKTKS